MSCLLSSLLSSRDGGLLQPHMFERVLPQTTKGVLALAVTNLVSFTQSVPRLACRKYSTSCCQADCARAVSGFVHGVLRRLLATRAPTWSSSTKSICSSGASPVSSMKSRSASLACSCRSFSSSSSSGSSSTCSPLPAPTTLQPCQHLTLICQLPYQPSA